MSQEEQAKILAEWLAGSFAQVPPEGVDLDVVESVFALRPDLAPPPRVTVDEILDGVRVGPFGSGDEADEETSKEMAAVVPLMPAARRARWAFAGGTAATIALAATVLLTARVAFFSPGGEIPLFEAEKAMTTEQKGVADTGVRGASPVVPRPTASPKTAAPQRETNVADAAQDYRRKPLVTTPSGGLSTHERTPDMPIAELSSESPPPIASPQPPMEEPAPVANLEYGAVADLDEVDEDPYWEAEGEWEGTKAFIPEAMSRGAADMPSPAAAGAEIQADAWDDEAKDLMSLAYLDEPEMVSDEKRSVSHRDRTPTSKKPKASAPAPTMAEEEAIDWRSQAMPTDLSSGWRGQIDGATLAEVDNTRDEATNLANRGNYSEAGEVMLQAVSPPVEVGQAQAAASAEYFLAAGDPASASTAAQKGLSLSSANTAWRSYLLVLLGDARRALGDDGGAVSAWQEASALNRSR